MPALSEFSSIIRETNVSRPYLFYVTLLLPPALTDDSSDIRKVSMFCHSAMTPGITMYTNDNYVEAGIKRRVSYDYDVQNLTLQFYVDSNFEVKEFFDKWKSKIVGNRRNFEYPESYTAEKLIVNILSLESANGEGEDSNKIVYSYIYKNVYPKSIQPIDLNNASVGQITTFAVDFVFDSVEAESAKSSTSEIFSMADSNLNAELLQSYMADKTKILTDYAGTFGLNFI